MADKTNPEPVALVVSDQAAALEVERKASDGLQGEEPPMKPFPWPIFLFCYFGWTFDFLDLVLLGFVKSMVAEDLGITERDEAWMLGVSLGTSGLGGIIAGFLADRIGKRDILAATILMYSLGSLITALSPNFAVFLVGRAIVGLGVGGEWSIGHALVAESVDDRMRGRGSAFLQSGEPVGVTLAAILGFLVAPRIGWRWVMGMISASALLAIVIRRSMHIPNVKAADHTITCRELRGRNIFPRALAAFLLGVFKLGTYWSMYTWLPGFLVKEMHQGVAKSFSWVLTAQSGQLLGMLCFGHISDRIGRRPAVSSYSALTAIAVAGLAYRWEVLSRNMGLFWATMFSLGLGSGLTAVFGSLLAELFPTEIRSVMMGTVYNSARAVQLLSPVAVEAALEWKGLAGALTVPLCLAVATGLWVWVLPETKGIELPTLKPHPPLLPVVLAEEAEEGRRNSA